MNGYQSYTPVRIAIPFTLGIIFMIYGDILEKSPNFLWIGFFPFLGMIFAGFFPGTSYRFRYLPGVLAFLALFFFGASLVQVIGNRKEMTGKNIGAVQECFCLCAIREAPAKKTFAVSCKAEIMAFQDSTGTWQKENALIMIYFRGDTLCGSLGTGDVIVCNATIAEIPGPSNPGVFNYKKYLANRQIYYQASILNGQWERIGEGQANLLILFADRCRKAFLETFRKFNIVGQDFALVSALLLGDCEYLDAEIRQEFSYAGATHILSVSGLHVGIVYVAADKVLFFLKRNRKTRKIQVVLTILFIWLYALVTGMSTPVTRAALMFSLVAAGKMFKRSSEGFNILATAVFVQLLINPYEITQVGFQLSYLAVIGIFAFYKPLNQVFESNNRVISWLWPVIAVSLAAQLATSPLSVYYFNMFPVYFLLTNIIVVPLSGIIIYVALALIFAGIIEFTPLWLGFPLKWSLQLMRTSVETIQSWPGAVYQPVVLSAFQVLLIYLIIISLFIIIILKKRQWIFLILTSILLLSLSSGLILYKSLKNNELIVYNASQNIAIDLINRKHCFFLCDSALSSNERMIKSRIMPARISRRINSVESAEYEVVKTNMKENPYINFPFMLFKGIIVVFIDEEWKKPEGVPGLKADIAVISNKSKIDIIELSRQMIINQVVITGSVPNYLKVKLCQECALAGIPCHSVRDDGAFIMQW